MTATASRLGLGKIRQIAVNVHDLDRATAFYHEVLGMPLLFRVPGMSFFDCDGIRLMLGIPEKDEFDHPASVIYYSTEDIHAMHQQLAGRGVSFMAEPHVVARMGDVEIWMAFFRDSEDNIAALTSEVRARGS